MGPDEQEALEELDEEIGLAQEVAYLMDAREKASPEVLQSLVRTIWANWDHIPDQGE